MAEHRAARLKKPYARSAARQRRVLPLLSPSRATLRFRDARWFTFTVVRRLTRVAGPIATLVVLPFVAREIGSRFIYLPAYPEGLVGVAVISACLTATVVLALAAWAQLAGRVWVPTLAATAILGIVHGTTYESVARDSLTIMRATALAMGAALLATQVAKRAPTTLRLRSAWLHAMAALVSLGVLAYVAVWAVAEQRMFAAHAALREARSDTPGFPWRYDGGIHRDPEGLLEILCVVALDDAYSQAVFDYCEARHLGVGVGGGCSHFKLQATPPKWLQNRACFARQRSN